MKRLWRQMTGRCIACGQNLDSRQTPARRIARINKRAGRRAKSFGRMPRTQSCRECKQIVIEGEPGFVENYLLIDMDYLTPVYKPSVNVESLQDQSPMAPNYAR